MTAAVTLADAIVNSFTEAAGKLGLRFEPRFAASLPGGIVVRSLGLVHGFGAPAGTLLFCQGVEPSGAERDAMKSAGYFYSILFPPYATFSESHFIDTLNDWGFFGEQDAKPAWFTGEPWTS